MKAPYELTASQARVALESNTLTSEALVHSCIERIQDRESTVHAWVQTDFAAALAAARAADRPILLAQIAAGLQGDAANSGAPLRAPPAS